ncbi:MAG: hypothetical protein ACE1ZA_08840, partial [Pseudomonadales bacterium]
MKLGIKQTTRLLSFLVLSLGTITNAHAQPIFTKVFGPDIIGPGSVSTLTFTIDNSAGGAVTALAFTDALPTDVTIATPASASTDCAFGIGGSLDAPDGGDTITFSGGELGAGSSCTITVNVTSSDVGEGPHNNLTGDLTSSAGKSGTAEADLTVDTTLPGFSKSFAPPSIPLGGKSTLTLTIDNSLNAGFINTFFTDNLPTGMEVADPSNASTTCSGDVTAIAGASVISLSFSTLGVTTCTVTVDVVGTGVGMLDNVTGELANGGGKASDVLEVTATKIALQKAFTDDPVPPGATAELEFTIDNFDRNFSATSI